MKQERPRKLDSEDVIRLLNMFLDGKQSKVNIAREFNIHHSTVYYYLKKYDITYLGVNIRAGGQGVIAKVKQSIERLSYDESGNKINRGKMSYRDYIDCENKRRDDRHQIKLSMYTKEW